jgi:hypothetical protein
MIANGSDRTLSGSATASHNITVTSIAPSAAN